MLVVRFVIDVGEGLNLVSSLSAFRSVELSNLLPIRFACFSLTSLLVLLPHLLSALSYDLLH